MSKVILCHCEDVEIEDVYSALGQGYGDIETLKRYTGIGTGKCQGKCCFLQTLRILANLRENATAAKYEKGDKLDAAGDVTSVRVPTLRPPVVPMRIDDIIDAGEDHADG